MDNKELKVLYYYVEMNDMNLFFTSAEQDKAINATENWKYPLHVAVLGENRSAVVYDVSPKPAEEKKEEEEEKSEEK